MAAPKKPTGGKKKPAAGGKEEKKKTYDPIPGADPVINALRKFGLSVRASSDAAQIIGWLSTGNLAANWAISGRFARGYPLGKSVEIFGDPATGKSFFIQWAFAVAQALGGIGYLDDSENAFNSQWARNSVGVRDTALAYQDPRSRTVDEHLSNVHTFFLALLEPDFWKAMGVVYDPRVVRPCIAALDSLGHLTTNAEIDKPGTRDLKRAQDIHKLHRVLTNPLSKVPCVYIIAAHKIASIDQWKPDDSSGGKGTKYAASVRIDFRAPRRLKDPSTGEFNGVISTMHVVKNRIIPPWREVEFIIPFYRPANPASGLLPLLRRLEFIQVSSANSIVYQEQDTGIPFHASDMVRQDMSALTFLQRFPTFLNDADAFFEQTETVYDPEEGLNAIEEDAE